jgi:N-acetylmuramic acid 6-phosphate etherase
MNFIKHTEENSHHRHLESKTVEEILLAMNEEDQKVALAVRQCIPIIAAFVEVLVQKIKDGGRLFYLGAGTSGRLGIIDASECPPTFGVSSDLVNGIIAGGDSAIRKAVEFAEDNKTQAWIDLQSYYADQADVVVGITASGTTPYVLNALKTCKQNQILTACICCNKNSPVSEYADFKMEVELGAEFISGSTRLKAGTAQKLILNMISTSLMIRLGRVKDNKMVDMHLSNEKLIQRGIRMILDHSEMNEVQARELLIQSGSVRKAIESLTK